MHTSRACSGRSAKGFKRPSSRNRRVHRVWRAAGPPHTAETSQLDTDCQYIDACAGLVPRFPVTKSSAFRVLYA